MKKKIGQNCCLYLLLLNIGFRSPVVKASRLHREDHEFKSHREHFFFERRCSDTRGAAISLSVLPMSFFSFFFLVHVFFFKDLEVVEEAL